MAFVVSQQNQTMDLDGGRRSHVPFERRSRLELAEGGAAIVLGFEMGHRCPEQLGSAFGRAVASVQTHAGGAGRRLGRAARSRVLPLRQEFDRGHRDLTLAFDCNLTLQVDVLDRGVGRIASEQLRFVGAASLRTMAPHSGSAR